jgi:hypothetical protein
MSTPSASDPYRVLAVGGDGSWRPTLAAAALVRRLAAGATPPSGARPCVGELVLDDFARETRGRRISWRIE